jgi:hypothetical protein
MKDPMKPADPAHDDEPAPARKPYEKPAFVHETVFETMALACGKTGTTTQQCRNNRKNS